MTDKKDVKIKSVIAAVFFILVVVWVCLVANGVLFGFEQSFFVALTKNKSNATAKFFVAITEFGSIIFLVCLCALLIVIPKTTRSFGLPVATTAAISVALNSILKIIFVRPRPDSANWFVNVSGYSFPSGHSQNAAAIYFAIVLLAITHIKNKNLKTIVIAICAVFPLLIALSRVYLGVHYLGDVVAGLLIGALIATVVNISYGIRADFSARSK